jgi:hypothetical protein
MAMKVIGTGAPRMLTVRFRPCEVGVVLDDRRLSVGRWRSAASR